MKKLSAVLAVAFLSLAACGGGAGPNPGFSGLWKGSTVAVSDGGGSISYSGSLSVQVDDDALIVTGFCPDGTGSTRIPGTGSEVEFWGASIQCRVADPQCPGVATYASGSLRLSNSTLFVTGHGSLTACGKTVQFTATFTGKR